MKATNTINFSAKFFGSHKAYCKTLLWIQQMGFPAMAGEFATVPPEKLGLRTDVENNREVSVYPDLDLRGEVNKWVATITPASPN